MFRLAILLPNTEYAYAIRIGDEIIDLRSEFKDPWPTFRTLPGKSSYEHKFNPEGKFNFSFSIGACQRQRSPGKTYGIYPNPPAFNTIWEKHRHRISFHIVNGDYSYEETLDGSAAGIENNYKLYLDRGLVFSFTESAVALRADADDVQRPRGYRQHRR